MLRVPSSPPAPLFLTKPPPRPTPMPCSNAPLSISAISATLASARRLRTPSFPSIAVRLPHPPHHRESTFPLVRCDALVPAVHARSQPAFLLLSLPYLSPPFATSFFARSAPPRSTRQNSTQYSLLHTYCHGTEIIQGLRLEEFCNFLVRYRGSGGKPDQTYPKSRRSCQPKRTPLIHAQTILVS
ncbi:unnamed protein product [Chondrus crispus]|uniref:Uncharacterized protein n=1 Tax=Chondrus crispus TaxID=2769 RepID=R7QG60_CHOCR|nr:unnamed protein product [Chondrus crispus]CDF36768.1 unnamed protein product [Chondrus crispus]|eukprot:XP_005716587.1 unnamed protein product [Chondrus crispus]